MFRLRLLGSQAPRLLFVLTTTYLGIILHIYPSAKLDLAVLTFGTIGPVDGWGEIGSPHHAQHAQILSFIIQPPRCGRLNLECSASQCFFFSMDCFWLTVTLDILRGIGHKCYLSVFS